MRSRRRIARAVNPDSLTECRKRGEQLLSIKARTAVELRDALARRGFSARPVSRVVADLARLGYVNDERTAAAHLESRAARYGRQRIQRELAQRGVPKETLARVLALHSPEEERQALQRQWEVLWRRSSHLAPEARRRRVAASLARRGFALEDIFEIMEGCEIE